MKLRGLALVFAAGSVLFAALAAVADLPPGGTFTDDNGSAHEPQIEAIAAAGITKGCDPLLPDRYCPSEPVTRAQMAVLLHRSLSDGQLAAFEGVFSDVPAGQWYSREVEWLRTQGISVGCAERPLRYCPDRVLTRGEMAALLVRALGEEGGLAEVRGVFSDVQPGAWYAAHVERLHDLGITAGCESDRFCPNAQVLRDQMATFLARALGLQPIVPPPVPSTLPPVDGIVDFAAGGDIGANERTAATLERIAASDADFMLALGDLAYGDAEPSEWCTFVADRLGSSFPVQLVVGNHEDDDRKDGYIGDFIQCLPDRMDSSGDYGVQYYFDFEGLVRVIMIAADNDVGGVSYDYEVGSSHYEWLSASIDDARSRGIPWTVVGMHKVCISAGTKGCDIGRDLIDLLIDKRVDLVLQGHDHNYQRSKQVTCVEPGVYLPSCVADAGGDGVYTKGEGLVWVVAGATGGTSMYPIDTGDPELSYLAAWMGENHPNVGRGYLDVTVSNDELQARFVGSTTNYSDGFVIRR